MTWWEWFLVFFFVCFYLFMITIAIVKLRPKPHTVKVSKCPYDCYPCVFAVHYPEENPCEECITILMEKKKK